MKNTISIKIVTNDNGELVSELMKLYATDGQISIQKLMPLVGGKDRLLTLTSISNEVVRQEAEIELLS